MKKTKIVATIGPKSESPDILQKLSDAGVNVFRLNFSHGSHEEHGAKIDTIRKLNLAGGILLDTKGPEIRTGEVRGEIDVKTGDSLTLTIDKGIYEDTNKLSVNYPEFIKDVKTGTIIVIDSGVIKAEVKEIKGNDVLCKIIAGSGKITTKRHINLMGEHVSLPTVTENDWKDIEFGIEKKVDFIALSFVRTGQDIEEVREFCKKKGHIPHIIAKIENQEAVDNLEDIVIASDGIMVARGDLACEVNFAKVPQIQKEIMDLCFIYSKPVIVATQMLMSMVNNITPTRAEVSDVANAVYEGTHAVMTSDETTKGLYPLESIETMAEIVKVNEGDFEQQEYSMPIEELNLELAKSAISMIESTSGIDAIVVLTKSGRMASFISNERPNCPIFAFTNNDLACHTMSLLYDVYSYKIDFIADDYAITINNAIDIIRKNKDYKVRKCLVISYYKANGKNYPSITIREI